MTPYDALIKWAVLGLLTLSVLWYLARALRGGAVEKLKRQQHEAGEKAQQRESETFRGQRGRLLDQLMRIKRGSGDD